MPDDPVDVPAPDTLPCLESDRRRFLRYQFSRPRPSRFFTRPECQRGQALLRDISACGIGLILDHAVPVSTKLVVALPCLGRPGTFCCAARVLHVKPDGPERWLVGCHLGSPLNETVVDAIRFAVEASS